MRAWFCATLFLLTPLVLSQTASANVERMVLRVVADVDSSSGLQIAKVRIPLSDLPKTHHLAYVGLELPPMALPGESIELWTAERSYEGRPWQGAAGDAHRWDWPVGEESTLARFDITKQVREWIADDAEAQHVDVFIRVAKNEKMRSITLSEATTAVLVVHYLPGRTP